MSVLRLLIADDHEIVRRGLCALLKSHAEWEVCAEAGDGREAVEKAQQLKPDIVILDIGMPNLNGLIAARQILRIRPDQKILILTITDEEQVVREVLEAGARGFVLKSDAARDLVAAVEALQAGTTFFTSRIGEMVLRAYLDKGRGGSERVPDLSSLTSRERGMVQLLAAGLPLHERVGPLCGSESHHRDSHWPTMTSISLLWRIGSILSDEIKEIFARRVKQ